MSSRNHERAKSSRTKEQQEDFRRLVALRVREGLPKKIIMERTGASSTLIDVVAAFLEEELGDDRERRITQDGFPHGAVVGVDGRVAHHHDALRIEVGVSTQPPTIPMAEAAEIEATKKPVKRSSRARIVRCPEVVVMCEGEATEGDAETKGSVLAKEEQYTEITLGGDPRNHPHLIFTDDDGNRKQRERSAYVPLREQTLQPLRARCGRLAPSPGYPGVRGTRACRWAAASPRGGSAMRPCSPWRSRRCSRRPTRGTCAAR